jgi:hypothetical protein
VKLKSVSLEGKSDGFQRLSLGQIEFDALGLHTLELRPADDEAWTGAQVAAMRLIPK